MEQRIEATLEGIKTDISRLNTKVDNLQTIEITNGGGRSIRYKRNEFFQLLYDRPKEAFGNMASFSDKALRIVKFVGWVAMISYVILNTVKQ